MCCKEPYIAELKKPPGVWCSFCVVGKGCSDYENRPSVCKEFECLWLHSQKPHISQKLRFPADMRPDKCKVILNKKQNGLLFAIVPKDRPDAWKSGKIGAWLKAENQVRPVTIVCGSTQYMMPKD